MIDSYFVRVVFVSLLSEIAIWTHFYAEETLIEVIGHMEI
jgi:hypothetical protein